MISVHRTSRILRLSLSQLQSLADLSRRTGCLILFMELGGRLEEREGSRIKVTLFGQVRIFHRPHPSPDTDKGAVASIRRWLENNGVTP